ncbi:cell division protein [Enterococcus asini]|uniref:cell division protein n=1 Tax=Enterococcus TaxID=1350 RepID=UPI0019561C5A|nr:cell division protein [Enterococcus asini]
MNKKIMTREEVRQQFLSDDYFSKDSWWLKIRQSLIAILAWFLVILPFIWLTLPFLQKKVAEVIYFRTYTEELTMFHFLLIFLGCSFLVIVVASIILTWQNNRRFRQLLQKEKVYNEERLEKRREIVMGFYQERFGEQAFRTKVRFYSVKEEQNLATDTIKELYQKEGAAL